MTPRITHITSTLALRSHTSMQTGVIMLLTECNSGTIQTLMFGDNVTIELQNVTATSDISGTSVSWNIPR